MGFELTTLMVIGTDCTCSCKSNYHTITPTTASYLNSHYYVAASALYGHKLLGMMFKLQNHPIKAQKISENEKQKPTTPSEQRSKDKNMHLPITLISCYRHFNKLKVARLSYHRFTGSGIIKHFLITTVVKCSLEYPISRLFI
jgi:hypothetical protein